MAVCSGNIFLLKKTNIHTHTPQKKRKKPQPIYFFFPEPPGCSPITFSSKTYRIFEHAADLLPKVGI